MSIPNSKQWGMGVRPLADFIEGHFRGREMELAEQLKDATARAEFATKLRNTLYQGSAQFRTLVGKCATNPTAQCSAVREALLHLSESSRFTALIKMHNGRRPVGKTAQVGTR